MSADTDGRIIVWDANTGEETMRWHEHHAPVYVVQYSHDGQIMASAGMDEQIICWDTATGNVRKILDGPNKTILSLAF